jgi:hypothetical protein
VNFFARFLGKLKEIHQMPVASICFDSHTLQSIQSEGLNGSQHIEMGLTAGIKCTLQETFIQKGSHKTRYGGAFEHF